MTAVNNQTWFNMVLFLLACFLLQTTLADEVRFKQVKVSAVVVEDDKPEVSATLHGEYSNGCPHYPKTAVQGPDASRVIQVAMYAVSPGEMCNSVMKPFANKVVLGKLAPGQYLLRVLNRDSRPIEQAFLVR